MMTSGLRALALAMLLGVAVGCGHDEEEACDALPASTEASADGALMYSVSVEGDAPIRLPPADLITQFLPLVFPTENAETPSEGYQGGRCPRWVARARNSTFLPSNFKALRRCGCRSRRRL
jgi:hypothetical protein